MKHLNFYKMNKLYLLTRSLQLKNFVLKGNIGLLQFSTSTSSSDDEKDSRIKAKKQSEEALNKLNNLLKSMIEEDVLNSNKRKLDLAKPINRRKKSLKKNEEEPIVKELKSAEQEVRDAAKKAAESIGGDVKKTESELLTKLLTTNNEESVTTNLTDIVKGMKIEHDDSAQSRAQQIRQILQQIEQKPSDKRRSRIVPLAVKSRRNIVLEKIDLFGSEPLGIFTVDENATEGVENKTWAKLYERDLKLAVTHPPANYFQQMILWTEQGKVWQFPIDNEQGLEEEKKVYFAEHVFLEKHLEPWCPPKGPIRHFMELVCVGLSKNPYLTVEAKKEHIEWFKNYFEDKKQLLKETGAIQDHSSSSNPKHLES